MEFCATQLTVLPYFGLEMAQNEAANVAPQSKQRLWCNICFECGAIFVLVGCGEIVVKKEYYLPKCVSSTIYYLFELICVGV